MRVTPLWIGLALAVGALAAGGAICNAVIGAKRRRAQQEDEQRVATWEGEGGAGEHEPLVAH